MSLFKALEERLEKAYDTWIGKIFKGPLQPGEIANRAIRSMLKNKKISVNKNYVPNYYLISLSKADYMHIQPIVEAFSQEISEILTENARERNLTILGNPQVRFEIEPDLTQGKLIVETDFIEVTKPAKEVIVEQTALENTLTFGKKNIGHTIIKQVNQDEWSFHILQGPDQGKKFKIAIGDSSLGRKPENDIVLNDSTISRIHANVRLTPEKLIITDLGSINGIIVNGAHLQESQLLPGDQVIIGQTQLLVTKE